VLINYYPSLITANEETIIEYNRLRQIYKPEAKMISVLKERYLKVKDVSWILSKLLLFNKIVKIKNLNKMFGLYVVFKRWIKFYVM